ncbi:hypothetical protein EVAR_69050_1 [Eumeta japonica]|uniref:Uncharacterized protein n=1 Tax=Eumeta variegata TaxID=151549 RepID=A0A4C1ZFE8_EUMVA|nr:hypothetical protein EVAR_69050_1 [Eumeta japonica]
MLKRAKAGATVNDVTGATCRRRQAARGRAIGQARARKADGHEAANDVTGNRQGSVPVPPARPRAVCGGRAGGVGGA